MVQGPGADDKTLSVGFDLEFSDPKKTITRIMQIAAVGVDDKHNEVFRFKRLVDVNEFVGEVQWKCLEVHGIKLTDVSGELPWTGVSRLLVQELDKVIAEYHFTAGVLVSFNRNTCDNPIFAVELLREKLVLPAIFKYTLDVLDVLRKNPKLKLHDATIEEWPDRTSKGKPALKLKNVVEYLEKKPFEEACGCHAHDALADAIGVLLVLKHDGGVAPLLASGKKIYRLWSEFEELAPAILAQPVMEHGDRAEGWLESPPEEEPLPAFNRVFKTNEGPSHVVRSHVRGLTSAVEALMWGLFTFFFSVALVTHIASCTTTYATMLVQRGGQMRPRQSDFKPLSAGELYVWIGIVITMGFYGLKRIRHYWNTSTFPGDDGCVVPDIVNNMTRNRFLQIYANLSFYNPIGGLHFCFGNPVRCECNADRPEDGDPFWKIRWVWEYLRAKCQEAMNPCQHFAIDESMARLVSRYCPHKQMQPMKPIKFGFKIWVLALSGLGGYFWNFFPYLGKKDPIAVTAAQRNQKYVFTLIHDYLIPVARWANKGMCLYADNYFTSIKLWVTLRTSGIYAVGASKLTKPLKDPSVPGTSWPLKTKYTAAEQKILVKGWQRTGYFPIEGGGYLMAVVWMDSKVVSVLSTAYIRFETATVLTKVGRPCKG
jgi:hypothetical protein